MMTYLAWAARFAVFLLLFFFASQNDGVVELRLLPGVVWSTPLVLALLVSFVFGVLLGGLALMAPIFRLRRENSRLRRQGREASLPVDIA